MPPREPPSADAAPPGAPSRRRFLRKGIWGGALLLVAGSGALALRPTRRGAAPRGPLRLLDEDEYAIMAAVAARIVPGDGAPAAFPRAASLDCAGKIDELMSRVHPSVGKEFKQLLRLFENGLGGLVAVGTPRPFTHGTPAQQDARLLAWRHARVALLRSGYLALSRLSKATYYASPEVWPAIGYADATAPVLPAPGGP